MTNSKIVKIYLMDHSHKKIEVSDKLRCGEVIELVTKELQL
jgi:hypothetical protein